MSLPPSLRASITPPELELVASEQLVEIVPLVSMERTAFISGAYGPLRPPTKCKVPLWMASNLKLKKKCHIIPPTWLNVEFLQDRLTQETTLPSFSEMPFRFAEVAKILLDVAPDDLQNPEKIRTLLKDIREARQAKSREGLSKLDPNELILQNLAAMEINEIRPFFVRGMSVLTQLTREPPAGDPMDET
ncbi:Psf2-domain-containing protein [Lentinus tigrinus ALCF2SS1-7]|uniref:DNA replication complex GINS protein PSF2 n=1 Tax=Lentinus tigrinus ALCF2SS1-6 TaxID=1328759 RepID=A0A5C2SU15_9APHY|nr:Psf2-domain-containing protein [Lentinus tigrinus ALCF2SS1-6]RPD80908.1 Psf2-domain-containing protein [Lentinus tigrinus ALCF2SS1-7]